VENNKPEVNRGAADKKVQMQLHMLASEQPPAFCLPLQELDVTVNDDIKVTVILNTSLQIVIIQ